MLGIGLKIAMIVLMVVQLLAIGYATHLVRRTKYSVIWILCIICFATSFGQHLYIICTNREVNLSHFLISDLVISLCVVVAVLFANRLVNYIDKLLEQRSLMNKRILSAVLRTEEQSRSKFAKELHDGMGPLLSSAKMSLSAISTENMDIEQQDILKNTRFMIDEAIRSVREISNNMSPQILIDFGLAQGVQHFISRLSSLNTLDIEFRTNLRKERFDSDIEVVVYRVICELINNSLKHSGCSKIVVALTLQESTLTLYYKDDGCGFNAEEMMLAGMGLSNITSRIHSLNGDLQITSKDGQGMRVMAHVDTVQTDTKKSKSRKIERWIER